MINDEVACASCNWVCILQLCAPGFRYAVGRESRFARERGRNADGGRCRSRWIRAEPDDTDRRQQAGTSGRRQRRWHGRPWWSSGACRCMGAGSRADQRRSWCRRERRNHNRRGRGPRRWRLCARGSCCDHNWWHGGDGRSSRRCRWIRRGVRSGRWWKGRWGRHSRYCERRGSGWWHRQR